MSTDVLQEANMRTRVLTTAFMVIALSTWGMRPAVAGSVRQPYKVLPPMQQGNLTIFPVVATITHDTSRFLTLDEGLRSGEIVVTEMGRIARPMVRQRPSLPPAEGAEVNQLALINNSSQPLILLAGEIVTGGKQDRVIGSDRIVPPHSEPIDLAVFCVEPGRWTGASNDFDGLPAQMAQPSVRGEAMADRDQQKVWAAVAESRNAIIGSAAMSQTVEGVAQDGPVQSSSYAKVMAAPQNKKQVDRVAEPLLRSYDGAMRNLRENHAVGVVVAVNGRLEWVDMFASQELLQRYWPKLVRSYAAESVTNPDRRLDKPPKLDTVEAQKFLEAMSGQREISQIEADLYRQTEIQGPGWKAFRLTALLPNAEFDLHVAKMLTRD